MLARSLGCRLFRVSVKEDVNVGPVFRHLAACCLEEMHAEEEAMAMGGYQPPAISESIIILYYYISLTFPTKILFRLAQND